MISVEGLKVEFGVKPLFHDVSFVINDRDRIALVGKNGAGKSTMLKILCGLQKPTDGVVAIPNETTIGYLPQVMKLQDDTTVKEETRKAFAHNTEMKARLDKMQQEMADRTDYDLTQHQTVSGKDLTYFDPETNEPEYISHVDYWMPFIGNSYALHDANWRAKFGGTIYEGNGSHGCVNLPAEKAKELYGLTQIGDVVVVHQ